jgi:hypothetical protein
MVTVNQIKNRIQTEFLKYQHREHMDWMEICARKIHETINTEEKKKDVDTQLLLDIDKILEEFGNISNGVLSDRISDLRYKIFNQLR